LGERITEMEADSAAYRIKTERRIEDLNERLACERTDFAGARDVSDAKTMELELERTTLMERCNSLAESLKARESALGAAEQEIKSLTGHIRGIELEVAAYRGQAERHIEELNASLEHERATARDALDGKTREFEQGQASLTDRLAGLAETLTARESALADAEGKIKSLSDRIAEIDADAATYRALAERRIEELNAALEREREGFAAGRGALDAKIEELEQSRASLTEQSSDVTGTLRARENALADAEHKIKLLTDHIREIELEVAAYRGQAERRIEVLNASLEHERAMARDALDGKTREFEQGRASLTDQLAGLAETLTARDKALGEAEQKIKSLSDRIAEIEADGATYRAQAERRISDLNARLDREREGSAATRHAMDAKLRELELARASLTKRSNAMAGTLWARESTLADAERKVRSPTDHISQIEIEVGAYRIHVERRIEELTAALERERFEFAVALEKSREAYAPRESPAQQERTDSDEVFNPAELKRPIVSTSEAIHNSKMLKAKLAKLVEEALNDAAPEPDRSGGAQPDRASESRRPIR
jgi:chromosome segregation ATPase